MHGGRLPALHRHADRGRALAEGRARSPTCCAAGGHHRDQPARAGAAARRTTAATCTCACRSTSGWPLRDEADQIDAMQEELIDRFGKLPPQAQTLFDTHRLRVLAKPLGVIKIDAGEAAISCSSSRTRRSTRCASSSWCRRTGTSSSPARQAAHRNAQPGLVRTAFNGEGIPTRARRSVATERAGGDTVTRGTGASLLGCVRRMAHCTNRGVRDHLGPPAIFRYDRTTLKRSFAMSQDVETAPFSSPSASAQPVSTAYLRLPFHRRRSAYRGSRAPRLLGYVSRVPNIGLIETVRDALAALGCRRPH